MLDQTWGVAADKERTAADVRESSKCAERPYRIKTLAAYDLIELAEIMLQEPEIALDDLMSGDRLLDWICEQDSDTAREVRRLREWWREQPQTALWCAVLCCNPGQAFLCPDGTEVTSIAAWFAHTQRLIAQGELTPADACTDEVLTGLEVWLSMKTDPELELAEGIGELYESPLEVRWAQIGYLLESDSPLVIDNDRRARTPAEYVQMAYGDADDWEQSRQIPAYYQAAMQVWHTGVLSVWLRRQGLAELADNIADIEQELKADQPYAAFETVLRLLDPSLPLVQLQLEPGALQEVRQIPLGKVHRYQLAYKTRGCGVPFGVLQGMPHSEEVKIENNLITRRSGNVPVTIDINSEPLDCNPRSVDFHLDSGYTLLADIPAQLWYRMSVAPRVTYLYLLVGALLGAFFFSLPRIIIATMQRPGGSWEHAIWFPVLGVVVVELCAARIIWAQAVLQPTQSQRISAGTLRQLEWFRNAVGGLFRYERGGFNPSILIFILLIGLFWLLGTITRYLFQAADALFSAIGLLNLPLPLLWGIWGALFGAALGFWHVAPLHNMQGIRLWLFAILLIVMGGLFLWGSALRM